MEAKIENHPSFMGRRVILKELKVYNLETFEDVWRFCLKKGTEELLVIPKIGQPSLLKLLTATMQYQAQKEKSKGNIMLV